MPHRWPETHRDISDSPLYIRGILLVFPLPAQPPGWYSPPLWLPSLPIIIICLHNCPLCNLTGIPIYLFLFLKWTCVRFFRCPAFRTFPQHESKGRQKAPPTIKTKVTTCLILNSLPQPSVQVYNMDWVHWMPPSTPWSRSPWP